jgi:DNA-binding MarR family transcriptional regulator
MGVDMRGGRALDCFEAEYYLFKHYGFVLIARNEIQNTGLELSVNDLGLLELFWNVNRKILKRLAPIAQREGMSMTELIVLWKAHHAGARRVTALADDLGVAPSTLTGVLDRLVEAGLLDRDRDPDDRRAVVMKSTEKLGELIRTLKHASSRTLEKALRKLPSQTRERLAGDLACVLACLDEEERAE